MSAELLNTIAKEVMGCTKCPLSQGRCKAVPGEGSPDARVMFIGEAPGYHEDQQGRPFVGNSGELLDQLLNKLKIKREDVFITNVVKCRPPNNRDPEPGEMEACKNYLDRQIGIINPRLIITLGRISMSRYWPGKRIGQVHGQSKVEEGRMYMAMFHPSFALRDRYGPGMQMFKEDGLRIPQLLERAEEIARTELWGFMAQDIETVPAPPVAPAVSSGVAEKKNGYQAKVPQVLPSEEAETSTVAPPLVVPEVSSSISRLEIAPTENLNGTTQTEEAVASAKPVRRARKPKAEKADVSFTNGAIAETEAVVPTIFEKIEKEKAPPRRKKKEADAAKQLTMF